MLILLLYCLEFYCVVGHVLVLTGYRMLPRKDLVRQRLYFLFDLICAAGSYAVHQQFLPIIILQNIQHAFYFFTWESSWAAKRVVSWSSLDWDRGRWNQIDLVLGTLFDIAVHAMNCVLLSPFVDSTRDLLLGTAAVIILVAVVLYNPKLAWANPDAVPTWVKKRMRPLTDDQRQEIAGLEAVSRTILASAK